MSTFKRYRRTWHAKPDVAATEPAAAQDGRVEPELFERRARVSAEQCDSSGVMLMPQYFSVVSRLRQEWLNECLERCGFRREGWACLGLPTVALQADFRLPTRAGEEIGLSLQVARVGNGSLTLQVHGRVAGEERFWIREVMASIELDQLQPVPMPGELRAAIERFQHEQMDARRRRR